MVTLTVTLDEVTKQKLRTFKNTTLESMTPSVPCNKCRGHTWFPDTEPLAWKCTYCGNTMYYLYGTLRQQIDVLVNQESRKKDFIKSTDGKSVVAKRSEEVKMLKFKRHFLDDGGAADG